MKTIEHGGEVFELKNRYMEDSCVGCAFLFKCNDGITPDEYIDKCMKENVIYVKYEPPKSIEEQIQETQLSIFAIERDIADGMEVLRIEKEKLKQLENERDKRNQSTSS